MEPAVGLAMTVSGVLATVATLPPFVNVTCTDDAVPGRAAEGVPAPITRVNEVGLVCVHAAAVVPMAITTTTAVALAYVHVAKVPLLGIAPTFAVHLQHDESTVPCATHVAQHVAKSNSTVATLSDCAREMLQRLGGQSQLTRSRR